MTLHERVRHQIGEEGPQHESAEDYEAYIDQELAHMSPEDLLRKISNELEAAGVTFP